MHILILGAASKVMSRCESQRPCSSGPRRVFCVVGPRANYSTLRHLGAIPMLMLVWVGVWDFCVEGYLVSHTVTPSFELLSVRRTVCLSIGCVVAYNLEEG